MSRHQQTMAEPSFDEMRVVLGRRMNTGQDTIRVACHLQLLSMKKSWGRVSQYPNQSLLVLMERMTRMLLDESERPTRARRPLNGTQKA